MLTDQRPDSADAAGPAGDDHGVIVYELEEWTAEQRGALEVRLKAENIDHRWESASGRSVEYAYEGGQPWTVATELRVAEDLEEVVDALVDEVDFPDGLAAHDDDDDGGGEAAWTLMSDLYVASDRLKDNAADLVRAGAFFDAADAIEGAPAPYGISDDVWKQVLSIATEVTAALEADADGDVVRAHAQRLRDVLFQFV